LKSFLPQLEIPVKKTSTPDISSKKKKKTKAGKEKRLLKWFSCLATTSADFRHLNNINKTTTTTTTTTTTIKTGTTSEYLFFYFFFSMPQQCQENYENCVEKLSHHRRPKCCSHSHSHSRPAGRVAFTLKLHILFVSACTEKVVFGLSGA